MCCLWGRQPEVFLVGIVGAWFYNANNEGRQWVCMCVCTKKQLKLCDVQCGGKTACGVYILGEIEGRAGVVVERSQPHLFDIRGKRGGSIVSSGPIIQQHCYVNTS